MYTVNALQKKPTIFCLSSSPHTPNSSHFLLLPVVLQNTTAFPHQPTLGNKIKGTCYSIVLSPPLCTTRRESKYYQYYHNPSFWKKTGSQVTQLCCRPGCCCSLTLLPDGTSTNSSKTVVWLCWTNRLASATTCV